MKTVVATTVTVVGSLVVTAAVLMGSGVLPALSRHEPPHPPCDQLMTKSQVQQTLRDHADFASRIRAVGSDITIRIVTPCTDQPDKALVNVQYGSDDEKAKIDDVFAHGSGFGTAATVTKG